MTMMVISMPPQMLVHHPFMYFIRDTKTGVVIFSGRITNFPNQNEIAYCLIYSVEILGNKI